MGFLCTLRDDNLSLNLDNADGGRNGADVVDEITREADERLGVILSEINLTASRTVLEFYNVQQIHGIAL